MPPGQPPKKGNAKMLIIIGAVVLAVLALAITGGVLLLNRGAQTAGTDPNTGGSTAPPGGSTAPPPLAVKPSDAVKSYLEALAAGDAETALSFGETTPTDASLLTGAVLAQSNKLAPITDINVPDVNDEYAYKVDASYRLGKQEVNESFTVDKAGDRWKLTDTYTELDLSTRQEKTVPMIINGVNAKAGTVRLFPGAYQFTTGSSYLTWGEELLVDPGPVGLPARGGRHPADPHRGRREGLLRRGHRQRQQVPEAEGAVQSGVPNNMTRLSGSDLPKKGTLEWEATDKDALHNGTRTRLHNEAVASVSLAHLGLKAERPRGGTCTLTQFANPHPKVNVLPNPCGSSGATGWVPSPV